MAAYFYICLLTMISPQTIQQITNRIDILDVVGEFVKLKKRGTNYLGLCPFHNEKTPSFTVSPAKEIYKCFGCGKSGNTITFLMEHEKYSYVETLRWLAARYNVEIEETEVSDEVRQQLQAADSLYILNGFAQKFFSQQLFENEEGRDVALSYMHERGFDDETLRLFQVGYCPQLKNSFATEALQNQYSKELLLKSGLVAERNGELVDNYRGRIIFPVHSNTGKIIGFGARVIGKVDKAPKYINTPENEIYIKSKILYGMYQARQPIDKADECLLVEGYTDVISLHKAGVDNAVASGGTSLTTEQLRLVKKYTNNLTIIYDGDAAGQKAALRGLDMALEESLNVKLVLIPGNEDPDSYVKLVGANAFKEFIAANKKDFVIFQLEIMMKDAGNDVAKKNEVVNHIAETLSKINKAEDFTKQQEYIRQCASMMRIDETGLTNLVNKFIREKVSKDERRIASDESKLQQALAAEQLNEKTDAGIDLLMEDEFQEREIVKRLIEYGNQLWDNEMTIGTFIHAVLQEYHLSNKNLELVSDAYLKMLDENAEMNAKIFLYNGPQETNNYVAGLLHFPYELHDWGRRIEGYKVSFDKNLKETILSAVNFYRLRKIKRMYMELEEELSQQTKEEEYKSTIRVYENLKAIEREITKEMQTVYLK